jgi:hypothetical protein
MSRTTCATSALDVMATSFECSVYFFITTFLLLNSSCLDCHSRELVGVPVLHGSNEVSARFRVI